MSMNFARRVATSMSVEEQEINLSLYLKLAGLITKQIEAIKNYRTGGERNVTVQNVSVSEGS